MQAVSRNRVTAGVGALPVCIRILGNLGEAVGIPMCKRETVPGYLCVIANINNEVMNWGYLVYCQKAEHAEHDRYTKDAA